MDLNQFTQLLANFETREPKDLPDITARLTDALYNFEKMESLDDLGHSIFRLSQYIMAIKEVKDDFVEYLEHLINTAIIISIRNEFRVGFDALRIIFNSSADFYKNARTDTSLQFPIGVDRPLPRYSPTEGEDCDVVRPYITSTSFCGWTRCTVLEIDGNKYVVKYINTAAPITVRGEQWFAPLTSRTQDFEWRANLTIGSPVEALLNRVWYQSTIAQLGQQNGSQRVRVTYRRFAENGDREDSLNNKYFGLGPNEDEWIDLYSPRVQMCGTMANKKLCYYTANSDEILPEDNYDILFLKEYSQQPFHAIMRSLMCKSSCIVKFINTFTVNRGFQTVFSMMENSHNFPLDSIFQMIANAACLTVFIPRMDMNRYLTALHDKTYQFMREQVKNLTPSRIDMGYFCIDTVGRRIKSLSEVYVDQNQLRKDFIDVFLDLNLEKKMLSLRYMNDLLFPKKPYTTEEREALDTFIRQKSIFARIFQPNTHEQILSRTHNLLRYMIEKQIIGVKEFEQLWSIVPLSDQRAHAVIEKLFADVSKFIPMPYIYLMLEKLLNLKETDLTVDNINLLKELKNREISTEYEMRILHYLWDIISIKSINIKTSIEEEVEKVFKAFVSGIKAPETRIVVLESMASRLSGAKKVRNEIDLLKDFIMSYPEKATIIEETDAPVTIYDVVVFLKTKNIYGTLLSIIENTKSESTIRETLKFISFLFEYDLDDINDILRSIYNKLGPSDHFLEWVYKIHKRALAFIGDILNNTTDFSIFENLSISGFEALKDTILEMNEEVHNIKIMKTYEYKAASESKDQGTSTPGPIQNPQQKKQQKPIGPSLPDTKKHLFILVSPFSLIGMKFLNNLLLAVKNSKVYDETVKLIIQFIVRLDESMHEKTELYRKQFLSETLKEIEKIVEKNEMNDKIKNQIQVYLQLFMEIFSETEKNGIGDISPHFQNIQGEKLTFTIENSLPKAKGTEFEKFTLITNENCTVWKFKCLISDIIKESPASIDVIKFVNPVDDAFNAKSISDMFFYDGETIKVAQKAVKPVPKHSLLNSRGEDLSEKFLEITRRWFNEFKNEEQVLPMENMKMMAETYWKGSLFRQEDRLKKIYEEHDRDNKGYLTYDEFRDFFYMKSIKNEHAIWRILSLAGYKNNLKQANEPEINLQLDIKALPRRILSSPEVYNLIFHIFKNPVFKDVHLNFYRLLSQLEMNSQIEKQIEVNIYDIISNSDCMYEFCYILEVANSVLSNKGTFFYEFWQKCGIERICERINKVIGSDESIYKMDIQLRNTVLPNLIKILNMYTKVMMSSSLKGRIISNIRINYFDLDDMLKKIKDYKDEPATIEENEKIAEKLKEMKPGFKLSELSGTSMAVFHNLLKNYSTESSDFIPKLTGEIIRQVAFLTLSPDVTFDPESILYGVKNQSLNYRRGCCTIIYLYIQDHQQYSEKILLQLLTDMPNENKHVFTNYFQLLVKIVETELEKFKEDNSKDAFFIELANNLLNILFTSIKGEERNTIIGDKIIIGILLTVEALIKKPQICHGLKTRKHEIVEKCLFAYNIKEKLEKLEITEEMLMSPKQQMHFDHYVICKTDDTRSIAYNIVAKLHEVSKDQDPDFLQKYILPVFGELSEDIRLTTSKSLNVGLKNFGSTCYMNSMLQVLNSVEPFRNLLMQAQSESSLVNQLKNLFAALFYSERIDYAPKKMLESFVPPINPGIQQDTTEFLNLLFDQLQLGLSKSDFSRLLDEIFKGGNTAQMICHSCGFKKENKQAFFSFGVEIDGKYELNAALEGSHQGEVISDYFCDNCGNRGETTKRNILSEIPNILFIHLRRIVFNYDMFINMKIHTRLQFPQELNIEPYTKEGVELREEVGIEYIKGLTNNEEEMKKFEQKALHGKDKDFYKLKLKGIIVHSGSADVGHYYSILPDGKTWHKFDDSRVTIFPHSGFEGQCFGGTWTSEEWGGFGSSANAYVLVYEKVVKNPIRLVPSGENAEEVVLQYNEVKPHNSVQQYKSVWYDNHKFMVELHLIDENYSKNFMKFACSIMENSVASNKIILLSQILYTVTYHSEIVADMRKIFTDNIPEVTPDILYDFILKDKKKTFKLLFSYSRTVREFMAQYMQVVLFESYRKGDEKVKKDVIDLIQEYLANLTGEVAKNWIRIDGYLRFFELMVTCSVCSMELWELFKSFNLISVLIDFVMEKASPIKISAKSYSIGTKTNPMDFSSALNIIAFLLRHSYGFTGKNFEIPQIRVDYLYHLNDNDVTCLSHMDFYRKMLRERQNIAALSVIIQRLCIVNLNFSKAISEPVLSTISSITDKNDDMQDLGHLVLEILRIHDDYWMERAEFLLGWTTPYILGDNTIGNLETERYTITSTLYDIFPVEALLNYVFVYRGNIAAFQLLRAIVKGCSVTNQSMKFLAMQPSPNYAYPSYIDWIKTYIHCFLGFHTMDQKKRERIEKEIQELDIYVEDILKFRKEHPENNYYKSIISGRIKERREIAKITSGDVQVVIKELDVYCIPSQPTGAGNASISHVLAEAAGKKLHPESSALNIISKPSKGIALKMKAVQEDEDKELISLFDDYPAVNTGTMVEQAKENEEPVMSSKTAKKSPEEIPMQPEPEPTEVTIDLDGIVLLPYFREIQVYNRSSKSKMVKLKFKKKDDVNTILPIEFSYKISQKSNESFQVSKLDFEREWGEIMIDIFEQNFDKEKHDKKAIETDNWFKVYGARSQIKVEDIVVEEPKKQEDAPRKEDTVNNETIGGGDPMEMNCPVCTFLNLSSNQDCEVCGSPLH